MARYRASNGRAFSPAKIQWGPTLAAHDPNPPLPLEDQYTPPDPIPDLPYIVMAPPAPPRVLGY